MQWAEGSRSNCVVEEMLKNPSRKAWIFTYRSKFMRDESYENKSVCCRKLLRLFIAVKGNFCFFQTRLIFAVIGGCKGIAVILDSFFASCPNKNPTAVLLDMSLISVDN